MSESTGMTESLIDQTRQGDNVARLSLLERYRDYLKRMVAVRLDRRLAPRVDASDVVQETLATASRGMDDFLRDQPIPFIGWLRQLAAESIKETHRRHIVAERRSVNRETHDADLPDDSAVQLGERLMGRDTSPSNRMIRQEQRDQVKTALAGMPPRDREVLVMRYLEHLDGAEIAEALGITEGAVKVRIMRALQRMRGLLKADI
jgi:RNA polymerase sigma-70 factor (ECF subfamily)